MKRERVFFPNPTPGVLLLRRRNKTRLCNIIYIGHFPDNGSRRGLLGDVTGNPLPKRHLSIDYG